MALRLPSLKTHDLPTTREDLLADLATTHVKANGYVVASTVRGEVLLFLREGRIWCGGILDDGRPSGLPIAQAISRLRSIRTATLHETDLALFLCLAVLVRKAPSAQLPAKLIDSDQLLQSVRNTGKDAVLVVQSGDARSLAFCRGGEPTALYPAPGEAFPEEGTVTDRIAEYLYAGEQSDDVTLLLYDEIRMPPAKDAVHVTEAAAFSEPPVPADETPMIVVRLGGRLVYRYPVTQSETLVGRGEDADLALDNLSVSRAHLKLVRTPSGGLRAVDLESENGILVGGKPARSVDLLAGQPLEVGKYTLELSDPDEVEDLSEPAQLVSRAPGVSGEKTIAIPRVQGRASLELGDQKLRLKGTVFSIGSGTRAQLRIRGIWIADVHAVVRRQDRDYVVEHVAGIRKLRVNGDATKKAKLSDGDMIAIGSHNILFRSR